MIGRKKPRVEEDVPEEEPNPRPLKTRIKSGGKKRGLEEDVPKEQPNPISEIVSVSRFRLRPADPNVPLAGKILKLHMINFMCHSNLELDFSKINFITGRNGSGKSAIVTALIVVLGGTASTTGRGAGVTDFIKKGENTAKITVTLSNIGVNSYKKQEFGTSITICRIISQNTANSSYTIKSGVGKIVSKKKEDVDHIISALNIQVKNPICILNQDVSRSFLCAVDNKGRYDFFNTATQLDLIKYMYEKGMKILEEAHEQLVRKKKAIENSYYELKGAKEIFSLLISQKKMEIEMEHLRQEYLWALVIEAEKKVKKLNETKHLLTEKVKEVSDTYKFFETNVKQLEADIKEQKEQLKQIKSRRDEQFLERNSLEKEIRTLDRQMEKAETQLQQLTVNMEKQLTDLNELNEHLEKYEKEALKKNIEENKILAEKNSLKEQLAALRSRKEVAERQFSESEETKFRLFETMETNRVELEKAEHEKRRLEMMLTGAKAKGNKNVVKFGAFTQNLLNAIEEANRRGRFVKKPVGPCGMYVSLEDQKWARAVEFFIGGLMTAYCVDNEKDYKVLSTLMDNICGEKSPQIIISRFLQRKHNVEHQKVRVEGLPSVVDVLKIDHPVVFNTFIDQTRAETVLLLETDTQAASLLSKVQLVPENLRMGLTVKGDQYYPAPNYRTYSGDLNKPLRYFDLAGKTEDTIKKLELELAQTTQAIQQKRLDMSCVQRNYLRACQLLKSVEKNISEMKRNENQLNLQIKQGHDIEESGPIAITKVSLEEEAKELQKRYEESYEKVSQAQAVLDSLKAKRYEYETTLVTNKKDYQKVEREMYELEEILRDKQNSVVEAEKFKKATEIRLKSIENELENIEQELEEHEEGLEYKTIKAKDSCPIRIETDKSPADVMTVFDKVRTHVATAKSISDDKRPSLRNFRKKTVLFRKMKSTAKALERAMATVTRIGYSKEEKVKALEGHVANLVSFYFQSGLRTRGFDGDLNIDYFHKTLDLMVKPKDSLIARKDSKTLSGGERSYSLVSFILAIWKLIQLPVCFLDEFDVFMDRVNRKVMMDLILDHANYQKYKQFFFITPLDISSVTLNENMAVFRLPDPERTPN